MNVLKGMGCLLAALAAAGAVEAEPTKGLVPEGETTRYVISVPARWMCSFGKEAGPLFEEAAQLRSVPPAT